MYIAVICSPFASHLGLIPSVFRDMVESGHEIELWGDWETKKVALQLNDEYSLLNPLKL